MANNTYVDLFCGAGGMSLGFDNAGFQNLFSVEFNDTFAATYKNNFPNHNLFVGDIKNLQKDQILKYINGRKVDVVIGGPPCQGFSIAGNIARNSLDDERNNLFWEFVRVVRILQPKMFVFENVANIAKHNKGRTIKEIIKAFENEGYSVRYSVLLASEYGVPQDRRRIFVVGQKGNCLFEFPQKSNEKVSIKDAIGDLPKLKSGESSEIKHHTAMKHSDQMLKKMSYVKEGGDRKDIPKELRPKSGDIRKYIRYDGTKPSFCVTGDMRKIFHYEQNRALTCRELARLQTFPDSFCFEGTSIEIQQQIGNAVPVKLAEVIALKIKEVLDA